MTIHWDGVFFCYDGEQASQGLYRADVYARGYRFARFDGVNNYVLTPAQQILWKMADGNPQCWGAYQLTPYTEKWLRENVGERGPDWYTRREPFELMFQSILFRRRRDALSLIRHINEMLRLHEDDEA